MHAWLNNAPWTEMSATGLAGRALWCIWIWIWASEDVHWAQCLWRVLQASLITNAWFFELWMLHIWRVHFTNGSMTCVWHKHTPDHCQELLLCWRSTLPFYCFFYFICFISIPFFLVFFFSLGGLSQAATGFSSGGFDSLFPRKRARCRYHDNKTSFCTT